MDLKNIEFIEKNKPAIDEDIHLVNNQIKGILPDVYKEFLKITNGAVLNGYVFYSTKEMIEIPIDPATKKPHNVASFVAFITSSQSPLSLRLLNVYGIQHARKMAVKSCVICFVMWMM